MTLASLALGRAVRVLNFLDVVLTLWTVTVMHAEEANPLLARVLEFSPALFVAIKLVVVGVASAALSYRGRTKTLAFVAVVYCAAIAAHLVCIAHGGAR